MDETGNKKNAKKEEDDNMAMLRTCTPTALIYSEHATSEDSYHSEAKQSGSIWKMRKLL
jgi:hypothetical protein